MHSIPIHLTDLFLTCVKLMSEDTDRNETDLHRSTGSPQILHDGTLW